MSTTLPSAVLEKLQAEDINRFSGIIAQTAGETINGDTLPVACFFDNSDDEWYNCDGNDVDKVAFSGFAISNGTDGNEIIIQKHGIVDGFTALTKGAPYYVQDDGTLGTSVGTFEIFVGKAMSTTQIAIEHKAWQFLGSVSDTADSIAVPAEANYAVVRVSADNGAGGDASNELTLFRVGKTSGTWKDIDIGGAGAGSLTGSASWSGSTITLSFGADADSVSGTAHFYR